MSRVGNAPIALPSGVDVKVDGAAVEVSDQETREDDQDFDFETQFERKMLKFEARMVAEHGPESELSEAQKTLIEEMRQKRNRPSLSPLRSFGVL